jgi:hypothetical protein
MSQLAPCPACSRHVRVTEPTCPFCGDGLAMAGTQAPALPKTRLGRAATFAFGATLVGVTTVVACGGDDTTGGSGGSSSTGTAGDPTGAGGSSAGTAGNSSGTSGGATAGSSGSTGGSDGTVKDSGGVMALYGIPADPDAGGPQPIYGAAPAS